MNDNPFKKLDSPFRRKVLPPKDTLLALGIRSGDRIADIGCGIGYFSIPAAMIAGENGLVYAVDVSEAMLSETQRRAEAAGADNIRLIKSEGDRIPMDSGSVSAVFFCNVLHEVSDLGAVLADAFRLLSNNGRLAVIEWDRRIGEVGPPDSHRLDKNLLRSAISDCGYTDVKTGSVGGYFYTMTATKPEGAGEL